MSLRSFFPLGHNEQNEKVFIPLSEINGVFFLLIVLYSTYSYHSCSVALIPEETKNRFLNVTLVESFVKFGLKSTLSLLGDSIKIR